MAELATSVRRGIMALSMAGALLSRIDAAVADEILTNAVQVRSLTVESLRPQLAVRLTGVITYAEPAVGLFFVQDETAGVMVRVEEPSDELTHLQAGLKVSVSGFVAPGNFAPLVRTVQNGESGIHVLGPEPLPRPRRVTGEEVQRGFLDSQWIEMRGIIRAVAVEEYVLPTPPTVEPVFGSSWRMRLEMSTAAGRFTLVCPCAKNQLAPTQLVDAQVRVDGVLGSIVNSRRQWVGLLIYTPSLGQISVERPPRGDPFSLPFKGVSELLKFSPEGKWDQRERVLGSILLMEMPDRAYLQCESGSLEVRGTLPAWATVGQVVDVAGYPALQEKRVILTDALFKKTAGRVTNEPVNTTATTALDQDLHSALVQIKGNLVQNTVRGGSHLLVLQSDGLLVEATLPKAGAGETTRRVDQIQLGSVLELTGVSKVATRMEWSGLVRPLSLAIMLRDAADIRVLRVPPWWTTGRLLALVGTLVALIMLCIIWVAALQRRVAAQTQIIKERIEREALWRDRSRIAQDIHDDLGASLTQVAFLSQRVQAAREQPEESAQLADRIDNLARSTIRSLDEIVWAVNPRHDTLQSLADYVCQLVHEQFHLTPVNCRLDVPTVLPEVNLRAEVRHNLALAVKEALHNVVKHAGASNAEIGLRIDETNLTIKVRDDGRGFDAPARQASRNGLANIERRVAELGGSHLVESAPGCGTLIQLTVPRTRLGPAASD